METTPRINHQTIEKYWVQKAQHRLKVSASEATNRGRSREEKIIKTRNTKITITTK